MQTLYYRGKCYKIFEIEAFGNKEKVIVIPESYAYGNGLSLVVISIINDGLRLEPYGVLTLNLSRPLIDRHSAFVKNYSENSEWAEQLAKAIGGVDTGKTERAGFVRVPLYDFSHLDIYADDTCNN